MKQWLLLGQYISVCYRSVYYGSAHYESVLWGLWLSFSQPMLSRTFYCHTLVIGYLNGKNAFENIDHGQPDQGARRSKLGARALENGRHGHKKEPTLSRDIKPVTLKQASRVSIA